MAGAGDWQLNSGPFRLSKFIILGIWLPRCGALSKAHNLGPYMICRNAVLESGSQEVISLAMSQNN